MGSYTTCYHYSTGRMDSIMADIEEVCDKCKFYYTFGVIDREGKCRRKAPVVAGGTGMYSDSATWPKVYGNTMWCGEFKSKRSTFPDSEE